ncbi:glycosyltransferase family 2 protein [Orenia metallireducens]|uniref:glycosyltransferase family 2 protein n=1 Tax=Orenia metallireducens TaxID=1413210 RepID=UPI0009F6B71C|nr:glycosyltransferase family 2 protein [Orenia metallireducens]
MGEDIALIIPAYNEVETIGEVIEVAQESNLFNEIVVVSDGSEDGTVKRALDYGVKTIALPKNLGKGAAMTIGMKNTLAEVIVFLDADLVNLREKHIKKLLAPIIARRADMSCGLFSGGRENTDFAQRLTPYLTGQRALRREIIDSYEELRDSKFGAELYLTKLVIEKELKVEKVLLEGLTHRMKEEKRGFIIGIISRIKMYWEVFKYFKKNNLSYNSISSTTK